MTPTPQRLAYQRGYYWPAHLPPTLPEGVQADLLTACIEAEATIDNYFAVTDDEEDFFGFGKVKRQLLEAMEAVTSHALADPHPPERPTRDRR